MNEAQLFASPDSFRSGFERGLVRLLDNGDLNLFILVVANAGFEPSLFARLRERLYARYLALSTQLQEAFAGGRRVNEADDDLLVFLKIHALGFDALALAEQRRAGAWEVQFNQLRSFRPLRNGQRPMTSIRAPFDDAAFNFNKPFIQAESLWSGEMLGMHFDLYYNKYPFIDQHCLLVPERRACVPQYHHKDKHLFVWRLVAQLKDALPGMRVAYNALGAFASVNHLHFQLFLREQPLPVENQHWRHNGGDTDYPVDCRCYRDADEAWAAIERLHVDNHAYNLLYTPRGMYCIAREMQGGFPLANWSSGFSWYEMSGGMITFNREDYLALDAHSIEKQLGLARLGRGNCF